MDLDQTLQNLEAVARKLLHLADTTPPTLVERSSDLPGLYKHFGVEPAREGYWGTPEIREVLENRIRTALATTPERAFDISDVRDVYLLWHEAQGTDVERALRVVLDVRELTMKGTLVSPLEDEAAWKHALPWVLDLQSLAGQRPSAIDDAMRPRARAVGRAVKFMRAEGIPVIVAAKYAGLSREAEHELLGKMDALMRTIGGPRYIQAVFATLSAHRQFDTRQQRYRIVRRIEGINSWLSKTPGLPFGYLLNIAARHAIDAGDSSLSQADLQDCWKRFEELGRQRCVLYDVEPYGQFDGMFVAGRSLISYLRELVLFDGIFCIPQESPDDVRSTIRALFENVVLSRFESDLGFSIGTAADVAHVILHLSRAAPRMLQLSQIARRLPTLPPLEILEVLRTLAQPATRVNRDFVAPHELSKVTFPRKPVIALRAEPSRQAIQQRAYELFEKRGGAHGKDRGDWFNAERELAFQPDDSFVVPNASWAAPGFLRAIVERIKSVYPVISAELGAAQEILVRQSFLDKGAIVHHGNFNDRARKLSGDCDGIVETATRVLLLESKKEDLTLRSREGSELDIILDLADSLLKAQLQLAKQEWILRMRGRLDLGGVTVARKDRAIERIVISLADHGALHSRAVIMRVLESFAGAQIDVTGPMTKDQVDKLGRLQNHCRQLGEIEREIYESKGDTGIHFYDIWFIPLSFLRYVLRDSATIEDFVTNLRKIKGVSTGMHDVFADYAALSKLGSS